MTHILYLENDRKRFPQMVYVNFDASAVEWLPWAFNTKRIG